MNTITLKLNEQQINQLMTTFKNYIKPSPNQYIRAFIKNEDLTISIYTSNKVVFQGNDAHFYASALMHKDTAMAGSDEVGTGDYFGPVCVCACIVEEKDYELLNQLKVDDSKKITDEVILNVAPQLMANLKHSLLILDNEKYNRAHERCNLNEMKAKLHNQAYVNLLHKGYSIPSAAYVDQFEPESAYFRHLVNEKEVYHQLTFETKAESKYIAVAAASMIARYAFIKSMEKMSEFYHFDFPKGAGDIVDVAAKKFVESHSMDELGKVAKLHFKNTEKLINNLKQK